MGAKTAAPKKERRHLTKPDKYVTILIKAYCIKTVGGSNLPPEMEVSLVDILSVVIQLLHLILDAVKVTFDLSNKKDNRLTSDIRRLFFK